MKINISRQNIYLLSVSIFLLIFVLLFSFLVLIPEGQEYRVQRVELQKETKELRKYQNFNDEVLEHLKQLQSDNRNIITAFETEFSAQRFEKKHRNHFSSFNVAKQVNQMNEGEFIVYEVNTTSQISSPKGFYGFLDAVNKSDWIIGINFPIRFKRDGELIKSSFTMKVYSENQDSNKTEDLNVSE